MAVIGAGRLIVCLLICVQLGEAQFTVPDVVIQALRPKGIRVYIPDSPNVSLFVFQGNLNRKIGSNDVGSISGEVTNPKDGRWLFEDPNVQLRVGDIINYYVYVVNDKKGYLKDNLSYTVSALESPSSNSPSDCKTTPSLVRGGKACSGEILFEDNFDNLREDLWQIEQYIPDEPDFPFVSYQRPFNAPTVSVEGGYLKIEAKLQQDLPGYSNSSIYMGTLDLLSGCTAISTKCRTEAWGASILPPIASGKLSTKAFAFTYGVVEVRAKLPQGDWLYPDILLESLFKKYGVVNYASGVLRIAAALGNDQLSGGSNEMGNKVLYGGPIMDFKCRKNLLSRKTSSVPWADDFHVYSLRWEPEHGTIPTVPSSAVPLGGRLRSLFDESVRAAAAGKRQAYDAWAKSLVTKDPNSRVLKRKYIIVPRDFSNKRITLFVDGEEWGRVEPAASGLVGRLRATAGAGGCDTMRAVGASDNNMAPFDDHFFLTLGLMAGGITEFEDDITSRGIPKPWRNSGRKASLRFWQDMTSWFPTWRQPALLVDYVRVRAL